ncbi:MAG: GNAT family N-acetyltransferase [Pirellulales bacterium]|nr:GNAT family N-acetyltransferase [Pirellulales bacterium]
MYITRHDNFDSLAAVKSTWNELSRGVAFRAWGWLDAWWRYYGCGADGRPLAGRELLLLAAWSEQQQLVAVAPWYRQRTRTGTQLVRFLGSGEVCSEYPSILCRREHEGEVADAITQWLMAANASPGNAADAHWDRLELTPLDPDDSMAQELLNRLEACGNRTIREAAASCWRVPLPTTWDEYLATRSKQHRNRLRNADRTWIQSGKVILRTAPRDCDAESAFDILVDLHQRRWQSRGLPGCFRSQQFSGFHRDVWQSLAAAGQARIYWLEMDGKPLAADYVLLSGKTMCGYQSGIDPDRLSMQPGQLMNSTAIRAALESGFTTYDFLRGDEPYKAHLGAQRHEMFAVRVVPQTAEARLRYAAWNAGRQMRGWAKRGLQVAREWRAGHTRMETTRK